MVLITRSQNLNKADPANRSEPAAESGLTVQLATAKAQYNYRDPVKFTSTVRNATKSPKTYSFNSTCTQGTLFIDNMPTQVSLICNDAITDVVLRSQEVKTYQFEFKLVEDFSAAARNAVVGDFIEIEGELRLKPGQHMAYIEWQDATSEPTIFSVTE